MADETLDHLDRLVRVNREAEAGYRAAADKVRNSELETLFIGHAKQHQKFAIELEEEQERRGGKLTNAGSLGNAIHRGWMDLKGVLSGHSAMSVLASCQDGETSAENAYLDAADTNPTGQTRRLIDKHLQQIREFRTRLRGLIAEGRDGLDFPVNE